MKLRIIVALVLTFVLLSMARRLSERKPELKVLENGGIKIEHTTVTEKVDGGDVDIYARVETPRPAEKYPLSLVYRIDQGDYVTVPMQPRGEDRRSFFGAIPAQPKGKRAYYYLSVRDQLGNETTLPDRVNRLNLPFMIKFKGKVSPIILIAHIVAMFGAIFFVFLVFFFAIDLLRTKDALARVSTFSILTTLCVFLGGFPLGFLVAYQTFGVAWGGIPFGWDITDNKTLILLAYWLVLLYLMRSTITKRKAGLGAVGDRLLSVLTVLGVILTLLIYLIPHSI